MLVRYRYRIYPSPGHQKALARAFGCTRVVFNDCLRLREACHVTGEKISDTEVQRRVITLAKSTPERAWLAEVASVPLVQACRDARRAYRNWFDSLSGKRKGHRVGHPKFRSKRGRQSIRLTRNGFATEVPTAKNTFRMRSRFRLHVIDAIGYVGESLAHARDLAPKADR